MNAEMPPDGVLQEIYRRSKGVFAMLPLAAVIHQRTLVMHGGDSAWLFLSSSLHVLPCCQQAAAAP